MSRLTVTVFLACALLTPGCGGGNTISGKVTQQGKPLPLGLVTFHFADGKKFDATIQPEGTYSVKGVPTGTAKVTVEVPKLAAEPVKDGKPKEKPKPPDAKFDPPPIKEVEGDNKKVTPVQIDPKYKDVATSGLSYEISGSKTIDIDLK